MITKLTVALKIGADTEPFSHSLGAMKRLMHCINFERIMPTSMALTVTWKINLRGVRYTASGFVLTHQRRFSLPTPMEITPRSHPGHMGKWLLKWTVRPWSQRPD